MQLRSALRVVVAIADAVVPAADMAVAEVSAVIVVVVRSVNPVNSSRRFSNLPVSRV